MGRRSLHVREGGEDGEERGRLPSTAGNGEDDVWARGRLGEGSEDVGEDEPTPRCEELCVCTDGCPSVCAWLGGWSVDGRVGCWGE